MPRKIITLAILCVLSLSLMFSMSLSAQTQNLLVNPSFEQFGDFGRYAAAQGDPEFNFAEGWSGWQTQTPRNFEWQNVKVLAFPHSGSFKVSGNYSQDIGRSGGTWTAAAYQIVNNIANGTKLQATAKVYLENGNNTNARVRIGIGSNVAGDPTSPAVVWSAFNTAINTWQQISVETTVPAGSVTVFIYATQDFPNGPTGPNKLYIDDAALVVTGAGTPVAPTGSNGQVAVPPPPTSTPAPAYAAFVSAQNNVENGKIVHTVQSGDTLAAIAVAYGVPIATIQQQNGIQGGIIFPGQKLIIKDAPVATPTNTRPPATATTSAPAATSNAQGSGGGFTQPTTSAGAANTPVAPVSGNATIIAALATATQAPPSPTTAPSSTPSATSTEAPTEAPTQAPTAAPTNTSAPAIVNTPMDPSTAPTAPVVIGENTDPLATTASVCVTMFDDANQNRIQNSGEALLAGGSITLRQGTQEVSSYETDGTSEPYCFEDLEPGQYTAIAAAPQGYGLTTPASLVISVQAGTSFRLVFGAAQGVQVAVAPTADAADSDGTDTLNQAVVPGDGTTLDISSIAGILVIGAAALALVGGAVVYWIARRL
jgi:LysM repeat protein